MTNEFLECTKQLNKMIDAMKKENQVINNEHLISASDDLFFILRKEVEKVYASVTMVSDAYQISKEVIAAEFAARILKMFIYTNISRKVGGEHDD